MKKITIATALFLAASATSAFAGGIEVSDAWARASAKMARAGAAFITIKNSGGADRLIAAKSDVSKKTELHTHIKEGEIMKMRHVEAINVPANGMAMLKPGGDHVMFMGLKEPFKEGSMFPLTLVFEKAGEIKTSVMVKGVAAMSGEMKMDHGKMKH